MKRKKYRSPFVSFLNDEGEIDYTVGGSEQGGQDHWQDGQGNSDMGTVTWNEDDPELVDAINDGLTDIDGDGEIDWDDYDLWIGGE